MKAHNARRRKNRTIRRNAAEYAEQAGEPAVVVDELRNQPPSQAKQWLEARGMDPEALAGTTPDKDASASLAGALEPPTSIDADTWASEWWSNVPLGRQIAAAATLPAVHQGETELRAAELDYTDVPDNPGTNETAKVIFEDGSEGYHKPFAGLDTDCAEDYGHVDEPRIQPLHEVASWRVAHELGEPWASMVPPTVMRELNGEVGSLQAHRDGENPWGPDAIDEDVATDAAFFDSLIGQQDRHAGNMLIDIRGELSLIDHGFALANDGDYCNFALLVALRHQRGRAELREYEREALRRVINSPDLFGLAGVVERDRVDAVRARAATMLNRNEILAPGQF